MKVGRIPKGGGQPSQPDCAASETSGPRPNKTDVKYNATIHTEDVRDGNVAHQTEYNVPVSPRTVDRSRTRSSKFALNGGNSACNNKRFEALIHLHAPNHKLDKLLDQSSRNPCISTAIRRQLGTSGVSNINIKQITQQNGCLSQVMETDTGLSPSVKLALSTEHDSDRKLADYQRALLQAFRELDSRISALQEGARQLQATVDRLQHDFQLQESAVTHVTAETRQLADDIQDTRYLDDTIFLLQGQLDRITLRKWPFVVSHVHLQADSNRELNLVV